MEVEEDEMRHPGGKRKNFILTFNFDTYLFGGDREHCFQEFGEYPSWSLFEDRQIEIEGLISSMVDDLKCSYSLWSYEVCFLYF
jgi:hypothetical protein